MKGARQRAGLGWAGPAARCWLSTYKNFPLPFRDISNRITCSPPSTPYPVPRALLTAPRVLPCCRAPVRCAPHSVRQSHRGSIPSRQTLGAVHILRREAMTSRIPRYDENFGTPACCEIAAQQGVRDVIVLRNMWTAPWTLRALYGRFGQGKGCILRHTLFTKNFLHYTYQILLRYYE